MTNLDKIKEKCTDIDSFAEWLHSIVNKGDYLWEKWFDEEYCSKCVPEEPCSEVTGISMEFGWCELHNYRCKYFKNYDSIPSGKELIKAWLNSNKS